MRRFGMVAREPALRLEELVVYERRQRDIYSRVDMVPSG